MFSSEFNYLDTTKALELVLQLNPLLDEQVESIEDIETALFHLFGAIIKLRFYEVITPDEGPVYHYVTEIGELPVSIYVADWWDGKTIVAVNSGLQATYIDENMKNIVKSAVI